MVVYARSLDTLKTLRTVWREAKPGAKEIWEEYLRLRKAYKEDDQAIEKALQAWYQALPKTHPAKALSRYKHIDKWGPWRDRDISWPGGGGPDYDVLHPTTGLPCKVPERGWVFPTPEAMQRQIDLGLVVFRADHTQPPFRKAHLRPISDELDDDEEAVISDEEETEGHEDASGAGEGETEDNGETLVGLQVMPSVLYKQSQVAVRYLRKLMNGKIFDNPKDHEILARLIRYCTSADNNEIILDFFAGSCSSAEAVMQLNCQEKGNRHFIMVQWPEPTPEKSAARKAGHATITDIGKERMRRVITRIKQGENGQPLLNGLDGNADLGFRVFKLAPSNFRLWEGAKEATAEQYVEQMGLYNDSLVDGWTPEGILQELALKEGYSLTCQVETVEGIAGQTVYRVTDSDRGQSFLVCLDDLIDMQALEPLDLQKGVLFICCDSALDDQTAANLALQCNLKLI
jgi:adenine-specific DNA-methyltransferase